MIRIGQGFDSHRLVDERPLVLGGVSIDYDMGLDGNSDADVLCHAIMDALLGAIASGDIGSHFPDTGDTWTGAVSIELLRNVAEKLRQRGAHVLNIDSTLIAEKPKMQQYIPEMCSNIAEAVGVATECVSVKATTAEQMGAIGRNEGMAALAVVLVEIEE